jgi:Ca2+-binding RTX toxin-like protein
MGDGENTIFGGGGADIIRLNGAIDTVDAGAGNDLITLS